MAGSANICASEGSRQMCSMIFLSSHAIIDYTGATPRIFPAHPAFLAKGWDGLASRRWEGAMNDRREQSLATRRARRLLGDGAVRRIAARRSGAADLYHRLLTMPWPGFFAAIAVAYGLFNIVFAALYLLQPGGVANAHPGSFADAFFFSVQTMATIGYGDMHPATLYANLLVSVEVLLGMTGLALATGLMFARFSRPTARV